MVISSLTHQIIAVLSIVISCSLHEECHFDFHKGSTSVHEVDIGKAWQWAAASRDVSESQRGVRGGVGADIRRLEL